MSRAPGTMITKDPSSVEPQGMDWTAYLAELGVGVEISSSVWTVTGPDTVLTASNPTVLVGNQKTQVFLNAGTVGKKYTVTNRITTNTSPVVVDDRSFNVLIQNK